MAIGAEHKSQSDGRVWGFFKLPFRQTGNATGTTSSSSLSSNLYAETQPQNEGSNRHASANSVSAVAKSLLPTRHEPGKQVRSAVRIKNTSKSYAAFKFQTTAPKSCFMRPPGAILAPGEGIIATDSYEFRFVFRMDLLVFKFVEPPENNEKPMDQKRKVKFKIMSLKVKGPMDYVSELFDDLKDQVAIEQILRVVFLDPGRPCPALEKLKRQLADADAELEARKKPPEDAGPKIIGEGLVIDEW
ncbi:hypothetical protein Goshw_016699, partial [Gossypium schwendimanii]|nr:hypothetical protein [Gossypium schwendimanii]